VLRGITAIARHPDVLSVRRYKLFAFQVWSHKIMRWLVPWFLLLLLLNTIVLVDAGKLYVAALIAQFAFYGVAIAAHYSESIKSNAIARIVYFFVQVNVGIADATCRFIAGSRMTTWQPSAR
jgi:hypothetical protein